VFHQVGSRGLRMLAPGQGLYCVADVAPAGSHIALLAPCDIDGV
jgi:hypothetical protein